MAPVLVLRANSSNGSRSSEARHRERGGAGDEKSDSRSQLRKNLISPDDGGHKPSETAGQDGSAYDDERGRAYPAARRTREARSLFRVPGERGRGGGRSLRLSPGGAVRARSVHRRRRPWPRPGPSPSRQECFARGITRPGCGARSRAPGNVRGSPRRGRRCRRHHGRSKRTARIVLILGRDVGMPRLVAARLTGRGHRHARPGRRLGG
jgi:hypothetical protein